MNRVKKSEAERNTAKGIKLLVLSFLIYGGCCFLGALMIEHEFIPFGNTPMIAAGALFLTGLLSTAILSQDGKGKYLLRSAVIQIIFMALLGCFGLLFGKNSFEISRYLVGGIIDALAVLSGVFIFAGKKRNKFQKNLPRRLKKQL